MYRTVGPQFLSAVPRRPGAFNDHRQGRDVDDLTRENPSLTDSAYEALEGWSHKTIFDAKL